MLITIREHNAPSYVLEQYGQSRMTAASLGKASLSLAASIVCRPSGFKTKDCIRCSVNLPFRLPLVRDHLEERPCFVWKAGVALLCRHVAATSIRPGPFISCYEIGTVCLAGACPAARLGA